MRAFILAAALLAVTPALAEPCAHGAPGAIEKMMQALKDEGYEQRAVFMVWGEFPGQLLVNKKGEFSVVFLNPQGALCWSAMGTDFKATVPGKSM